MKRELPVKISKGAFFQIKKSFSRCFFFAILKNRAILIKYLIIFDNSVDIALACKLLRKYGFLCL